MPTGPSVADATVVVLGLAVVELEHEDAAGEQPFVVGTAVVALEAEEVLVPAAGRLDVAHRDHGLRLGRADRRDDADPVAGGVVELHQPALAVVEPRPPPHLAAAGDGPPERGWRSSAQIHTTGPRSATGARSVVHWPIIPGASKLPEVEVDRPAEDRLVERRRARDVQRRKLQVADLAVWRVHVASLPGVSATSSRRTERANQSW